MTNISFMQGWAHLVLVSFPRNCLFLSFGVEVNGHNATLFNNILTTSSFTSKATTDMATISHMSHFTEGKHKCIWGPEIYSPWMNWLDIRIRVGSSSHLDNACSMNKLSNTTFTKQRNMHALQQFANSALSLSRSFSSTYIFWPIFLNSNYLENKLIGQYCIMRRKPFSHVSILNQSFSIEGTWAHPISNIS